MGIKDDLELASYFFSNWSSRRARSLFVAMNRRSWIKARMISMFTCMACSLSRTRQHRDTLLGERHRCVAKAHSVSLGGHKP